RWISLMFQYIYVMLRDLTSYLIYLLNSCTDLLYFNGHRYLRDLHPFPTRRSSDLPSRVSGAVTWTARSLGAFDDIDQTPSDRAVDRKSTRLNSSHVSISYAVFCLKKKKICPK